MCGVNPIVSAGNCTWSLSRNQDSDWRISLLVSSSQMCSVITLWSLLFLITLHLHLELWSCLLRSLTITAASATSWLAPRRQELIFAHTSSRFNRFLNPCVHTHLSQYVASRSLLFALYTGPKVCKFERTFEETTENNQLTHANHDPSFATHSNGSLPHTWHTGRHKRSRNAKSTKLLSHP